VNLGPLLGHILEHMNAYGMGMAAVVLLLLMTLLVGPLTAGRESIAPIWRPLKRMSDYILEPDRSNRIARRFLYAALLLEIFFIAVYELIIRL